MPEWLGPKVFSGFFRSRRVDAGMGLHAAAFGEELLEMMDEFGEIKAQAGIETLNLDKLTTCARQRSRSANAKEA